MATLPPFTSCELRWFFDGGLDQCPGLRHWFTTATPVQQVGVSGPPLWQGRLGGEPDLYLLLPAHVDLGIKWREELLQIKGRVADLGSIAFGGGHAGRLESWIKWSYSGLPDSYRRLFAGEGAADVVTVAVHKTRALRLLSVEPTSEMLREVPTDTRLEHGIAIELTAIEIGGTSYCSLGVEAFPDESNTAARLEDSVKLFFGDLVEPRLDAGRSLSYPAWLDQLRMSGALDA